jgi:hypothetical protein
MILTGDLGMHQFAEKFGSLTGDFQRANGDENLLKNVITCDGT